LAYALFTQHTKLDADSEPDAIRGALLATRGLKGVEGTYNFDPNGDGVHGDNVVRNVNGKVSFIKHIEFDQ
jgi:branched-chain amino acid transport system substrate-binding protein